MWLPLKFAQVAVIGACLTSAIHAQSPAALDFEEAFALDFARHDIPLFQSHLRLDEQQTSILQTLHGDYEQEFAQAVAAVRTELRDVQALLGAEDAQVDQRREAIRAEVAAMMQAMQEEIANAPVGADVAEIRAKYEEALKDLQEELQRLRPSRFTSDEVAKLFEDSIARLEQWRLKKKELRDKFAGGVQAILREEQREFWPVLERHLRRQKSLGLGRLQGEGVDLLILVRDLKLDQAPTEAIAATLNDYEVRLDEALRSRQELFEATERPLLRAIQSNDRPALESVLERIMSTRVVVRNVNDEFAQRIAGTLPEGIASNARSAYHTRAYPMVFRDTQTLRLMKAARELEGLTPQQIEQLYAMQSEYETALTAVNADLLAAVRQHEPGRMKEREAQRLLPPAVEPRVPAREPSEDDDPIPDAIKPREQSADPMQAAFIRREEAGRPFDQRLRALMGDDLYERLPRNQGDQ